MTDGQTDGRTDRRTDGQKSPHNTAMQRGNYKNRVRLAKVIVKNKMSRFLWFSVYIQLLACYQHAVEP